MERELSFYDPYQDGRSSIPDRPCVYQCLLSYFPSRAERPRTLRSSQPGLRGRLPVPKVCLRKGLPQCPILYGFLW